MRMSGFTSSNRLPPRKLPFSYPCILKPRPSTAKLRAFLDAEIDISLHLLQMLLGNERPVIRLAVGRQSDFEHFDPRHQPFQQRIRGLLPTGTATEIAMQRSPADP